MSAASLLILFCDYPELDRASRSLQNESMSPLASLVSESWSICC